MIKKSILFLIISLFIFSCKESNRNDNLEKKNIEFKENSNIIDPIKVSDKINESIETFLDIKTLYPEYIAVEKKDSNLDLDTAIEQFIVLIDELNLVTIVVADFNKITREYFVAWERKLPLVYNSDFSLTEIDVLAYMHNLELVISGTTITNNNALYIFKKTAPPKGIHIYYKSIFEYESTGTVELVIKNRSLDYAESIKSSDKAYDVLVEKTNIINENTISVIREIWALDKRQNIFVNINTESTEQKINVKEKLKAIYTGNKYDFLKFIHGEWFYKSDNEDENKIIIINEKNKIYLKYKDGVEEFSINNFWHSFQRITLNLTNIDVPTITKQFIITLNSTDKFTIGNTNPSAWDGEYTRLNSESKNDLIYKTNTDIKQNIPFTGIYKNVYYSLNFSYPNYTKINSADGSTEEGVFTLFQLDNGITILQLKEMSNLRSNHKVSNFLLSYSEQKLESQIIRTLKLHEGVLTSHGIKTKSDITPIRFEQTEVLSNE